MSELLLLVVPAGAQTSGGPEISVVASGLDNPRGLAWGRDGALYVAEAGKGGDGVCEAGPEGETCFGRSGGITRIKGESQRRVASGLPSLAAPDGSAATGPHDVSLSPRGGIYTVLGLRGTPEFRDIFGPRAGALGHLLRVKPDGSRTRLADLAAYEEEANPDGGAVDSNPYSVLRTRSGTVVVDAGANALLEVDDQGGITTLAVFPDRLVDLGGEPFPMQAVPTSVVRGPDGAFYVGQLTGFPFPVGAANVYRVVPGEEPEVYASGFTNIIDIAFDGRGRLWVLEIAHNSLADPAPAGALLRVESDGSHTVVVDEGLFFPGGLAPRGGRLYVSNCGVCANAGEVLRITP